MLLTLTTTHQPATDLGFLLHKNPSRLQEIDLAFGRARVFYPLASTARCTAALLLELDPLKLTRRAPEMAAQQYVNDRPYVASSFMSVAIAKAFGTALGGRCKQRPALAEAAIPLRAALPVVPARGGPGLLSKLFEPLGYRVTATRLALDPAVPAWGDAPYYRLTLEATCRLCDLLRHLYVLLPVLDDKKHYWVGEAEIEKLLHRGEGWLAAHPDRELIVRRALKKRGHLARLALARLGADDPEADARQDAEEEALERPICLHDARLDAVAAVLVEAGARSVLDLGCGEGRLLQRLLKARQLERIVGLDASIGALEAAHRRLHLEEAPPKLRERIALLHGALTYRDARLEGFDAAALVEVVEHLDPPRLEAMERVVFAHARPALVVVTTPNRDYNAKLETLPAGQLRHRDHRFEWTRQECRAWADGVAKRHGYAVTLRGIGEEDADLGAPTQMAIFERTAEADA